MTERQSWTVALPPARALGVSITVGDLRIQGESRGDALIEVHRSAPTTSGLGRIPITIEESATEVRVAGVQLEGGTDPAYRTDVSLRVPRDSVLRPLRVMEGRLSVTTFGGDIEADVRRGPIEASDVHGTIRFETGIGAIVVNHASLSPGGLLRLRAFNGDVHLTLAARPSDARIMALALNGTIRSEIPLNTKDSWGPRWGEATLGAGEPVISLDVVNGRIEIKVAPR